VKKLKSQKYLWRAETAKGGEKSSDEHGVGVNVVREALDQLVEGCTFDQRHPIALPFLENDVGLTI